MLDRKHVVGIAAAMGLVGTFGLMFGGLCAVFAGASYGAPIDAVATGPTPIPVSSVTTPFGYTPAVLGLAPDAAVVLPGVPVAVEVLGVTLSVSGYSVAEVSGGGGLLVGFLVGSYYAIDVAREQRKEAGADSSAPSKE